VYSAAMRLFLTSSYEVSQQQLCKPTLMIANYRNGNPNGDAVGAGRAARLVAQGSMLTEARAFPLACKHRIHETSTGESSVPRRAESHKTGQSHEGPWGDFGQSRRTSSMLARRVC
jgi:hypothetical protein